MAHKLKNFIACFCGVCLSILQPALAQLPQRTLAALTADTSGWTSVSQACRTAKNQIVVLPAIPDSAGKALMEAQVTTRSAMGAIIYFTGGILIDHDWIRILGSGSRQLKRSLMEWNKGKSYQETGELPGFLLIADDATGGFFAVNGGALGNDPGKVYYLSPDNLKWEPLNLSYSGFIDFCLNGDLNQFYKSLRWNNWIADVQKLSGDKVFNFYPTLWSKEGADINKAQRKIVPVEEQYQFNMSSRKQLRLE